SVTLLIGIIVCLICDLAISGHFTWSCIPFASIAFTWVILFPSMKLGKKGIAASLLSLSIFVIPYLYLLSSLIKVRTVFSIGAITAVIAIVFLWLIFAVFYRIGKTRKPAAFGITFLLAIPFAIIINIILSEKMATPVFDVWDMLAVFCLLVLAAASFLFEYTFRHCKSLRTTQSGSDTANNPETTTL
ncbi:MAG: hypothetical protein K2N90_03110, partial [Lachnospiraceae bacterium]|nr:hypothetical protein [Lachnospiraceae bacterium]